MNIKLIAIILCVLVITILLGGCDMPYGGPTEHTFLQERENVVKVEICSSTSSGVVREGSKMEPLKPVSVLSDDEIDNLWDALLKFPAYKVRYLDHGYGDLLFVISYANGEQELIGYYLIGIANADGTFGGYRNHVLGDCALLTQLFAQYADPETLAEVSMSFQAYYTANTCSP